MKKLLVLLVLASCSKPAAQEMPAPAAVVTPAVIPAAVPAAPAVEAPKPVQEVKQPAFSEGRCEKLIMPFRKCGWACRQGGYNMNRCVNHCAEKLNKEGKRCVYEFGPMFD